MESDNFTKITTEVLMKSKNFKLTKEQKETLINDYIWGLLDNMEMKHLVNYFENGVKEDLKSKSDEMLINEMKDYYQIECITEIL